MTSEKQNKQPQDRREIKRKLGETKDEKWGTLSNIVNQKIDKHISR